MRIEKKIGDADQYALLIWDVFCGQKTEAVTSLPKEQKILNELRTKQYGRLFPGARSHGQQMGEGFYKNRSSTNGLQHG